jgi:hypothetical protein
MDLGNILLWSVVTLICVVPFILLSRMAKKDKEKDLQALLDFAAKNHFSITQHDLWFKSAIGLDEAKQAIVFISRLHGTPLAQWILLEDIQNCRVVEANRTVNVADSTSKVVDKIELVFTPRNSNNANVVLEFFNVNSGNLTPSFEFELAEKWSKIANEGVASLVQSK